MNVNLESTINNFKKLGIYSEDDIYLLRKDKTDRKEKRRDEVINGTNRMKRYPIFNIVAFIGDAYGDFDEDSNLDFDNSDMIKLIFDD